MSTPDRRHAENSLFDGEDSIFRAANSIRQATWLGVLDLLLEPLEELDEGGRGLG